MNTLHFATSLATQDRWGILVAAYLFLGGMGAAMIAISMIIHQYFRADRVLTLWGTLSGEAMLGVGSALLLVDLLHPTRVWEILLPWNPIHVPTSWIAWGTQFIVWAMVCGLLYIWPLVLEEPTLRRIPLVGPLVDRWFNIPIIELIGGIAVLFSPILAWIAIACGVGTAMYTGILISSFPGATLWHNVLVPPLFTVSAFSTALAWLLLVQHAVLHRHDGFGKAFERVDMVLIGIEILLVAGLLFVILPSNISGQATLHILWHSAGWVIGFLGLGLLIPFLMEIKGVSSGWKSGFPVALTAVLVLMGGFLLRQYFLSSGVYAFQWANADHQSLINAGIYRILTVH